MPSSGVQKCARSEEHTSELQSHDNLVCRLLLEKKTPFRASPARRLLPTFSFACSCHCSPRRPFPVVVWHLWPPVFLPSNATRWGSDGEWDLAHPWVAGRAQRDYNGGAGQ